MIALLPPDLAPAALWFLLAMSFVGSFISSAFGIGGGVFLLAVMGSILPPAALIPIHAVVQAGSNIGRAAMMPRHIHWPVLVPFFLGALFGATVGGMVAVNLPAGLVQLGVGLFILWSIFFKPPSVMRRVGWGTSWLVGGISSFLTMFFGATGPFVIAYIKGLGLNRMQQVATHATVMSAQHVLKSLIFAVLGFAFAPWIGLIVALILTGVLGTFAGRQVLTRTTDARFAKALNAILLLAALRLIYVGLRSVLG